MEYLGRVWGTLPAIDVVVHLLAAPRRRDGRWVFEWQYCTVTSYVGIRTTHDLRGQYEFHHDVRSTSCYCTL